MDTRYMHRAMLLANRANSIDVRDNPKVGAVLVYKDRIIGEGYHKQKGKAHAEVMAIASVSKSNLDYISKSTLYVTLEPCSHYGLTPPCTNLIIEQKIPKVIIGTVDPTDKITGVDMLKKAGIELQCLKLSTAKKLITPFILNNRNQRPFISLKWASSKDHFMGIEGAQVWLSNAATGTYSHKLRANHQAILIGKNTAIIDKPSLDTRHYSGRSPTIIILGSHPNINYTQWINQNRKIILMDTERPSSLPKEVKFIQSIEKSISKIDLKRLYAIGIISILVEGGAKVLQQFISKELWDEAHVIKCQINLKKGIKSPNINGSLLNSYTFITDKVLHLRPLKCKS